MKALRVPFVVLGVIVGIAGLGLLAGGAGTLWLRTVHGDADGFVVSPWYDFSSDGYAVTSPNIDLDAAPREFAPWIASADTRLRASASEEGGAVFVGIAPTTEVEAYLDGVAHSEVADLGDDPDEVDYRQRGGEAAPRAPAAHDIWAAQASGTGTQTLTWEPTPGEWSAVIMNADGSRGVSVAATGGIAAAMLTPVGVGLLVAGAIVLLIAAALLLIATAGSRHSAPAAAPIPAGTPTAPARYPLTITGSLDEPLGRGLWLVKWLLAIPHYLVLACLYVGVIISPLAAGIAIAFTGRYPRGLFGYNVGVMRWTWRVSFYAFTLGTDRYPPFTLQATDYPANLDVAYPEQLSRGLWLVKWLLAIPHYMITAIFAGGAISWTLGDRVGDNWQIASSGGLIGVLAFISGVILLFTAAYPRGLFDFTMGCNRWVYRVMAYTWLMTDEYPPFSLDQGGSEHAAAAPPSTAPEGGRDADRTLTHR